MNHPLFHAELLNASRIYRVAADRITKEKLHRGGLMRPYPLLCAKIYLGSFMHGKMGRDIGSIAQELSVSRNFIARHVAPSAASKRLKI